MIIAIDFDGTCVTHDFPKVGRDIGSVPVLKKLVANGHKLILFTMRSNIEEVFSEDKNIHKESGDYLTHAIIWFKENEIPLYGIQTNPTQHTWTTSNKCYAELYIDDAAIGCPLIYGDFGENGEGYYFDRPHVNWIEVENQLKTKGIIVP